MRRQTGQDGTGFFFLSLSPIQRMEKGGRNWLPMPWNRAGDIGRFTMLTDMHVKRLHFSFSKARQNRTEHTHTMDMTEGFAADSGKSPKQGWRP